MHSYILVRVLYICTYRRTVAHASTDVHTYIVRSVWRASQPRRVPPEDATAPFPPLTITLPTVPSCQALSRVCRQGLLPRSRTRIPQTAGNFVSGLQAKPEDGRAIVHFYPPSTYTFTDSSPYLIQEGISSKRRLGSTAQQPDSSRGGIGRFGTSAGLLSGRSMSFTTPPRALPSPLPPQQTQFP
ncbi:hypothetical protein L209DRAFT_35420 [Thermothelomyces heterothallicus CBS 203.75]